MRISDWSSDVCSSDLKIVTLPLAFPALHASHGGIWLRDPDGQTRAVSKGEAVGRAAEPPVLFLNAPLMGQRLGFPHLSGLDLLELFSFVHPPRFDLTTPKGFARAHNIFLGNGDVADSVSPSRYNNAHD